MSETQGRGPEWDDSRIESAAQRAKENGGTDDTARKATKEEFGPRVVESIVIAVQKRMRQLMS